jgi:hypothetical protein
VVITLSVSHWSSNVLAIVVLNSSEKSGAVVGRCHLQIHSTDARSHLLDADQSSASIIPTSCTIATCKRDG